MRNSLQFYSPRFLRTPQNSWSEMITELDQLFGSVAGRDATESESSKEWFAPSMDAQETEKDYLFTFDLPGMKEKDLVISMVGRTLTVSGERKRETEVSGRNHRLERSFGKFERKLTLPEDINQDKVEAIFKDGVLELRVAKLEAAQPKTIAIKSH